MDLNYIAESLEDLALILEGRKFAGRFAPLIGALAAGVSAFTPVAAPSMVKKMFPPEPAPVQRAAAPTYKAEKKPIETQRAETPPPISQEKKKDKSEKVVPSAAPKSKVEKQVKAKKKQPEGTGPSPEQIRQRLMSALPNLQRAAEGDTASSIMASRALMDAVADAASLQDPHLMQLTCNLLLLSKVPSRSYRIVTQNLSVDDVVKGDVIKYTNIFESKGYGVGAQMKAAGGAYREALNKAVEKEKAKFYKERHR